MYAGSEFNWYDLSSLSSVTESSSPDPIVRYLLLITSDKGTESLTKLNGDDWFKMYGKNPSFDKHGQPLIQAASVIEAGGVGITKRIVADDATLSNAILMATVEKITLDKTDAEGNQLYIDPVSGNETTDPGTGNAKATYNVAQISHSLLSVENAKTYEEVIEAASDPSNSVETETKVSYPLYAFIDNGRGYTGKKIKINPEYKLSRNSKFMMYTASEYEGSEISDSCTFTADPSVIHLSKSYELSKYSMDQINGYTFSENVYKFVNAISEITGYGSDYLITQDFIFGATVKGAALENVQFDETSVDFTTTYGIELQNGSNGSFGEAPFGTDAYANAIVKYLSGEDTDEIYDFTELSADVIFDANYPESVKNEIQKLVDFRKDMVFFRDLGLNLTSYDAVAEKALAEDLIRTRYQALYSTSYDVYDPLTKRPIQVTMMYGMAPLMIDFFNGGRYRPLCGPSNGMQITNYIPGTIRWVPRITPKVNQKTQLEDLRVNYCCKTDPSTDALVIETCYTSQEELSDASYVNNILAIQQVIKAIRSYSPKVRYAFTTGSDFSDYKKKIEDNVLIHYNSHFTSLELVYTVDPVSAAQKIFKAAINVSCGDFIQSEIYDVFIIK